MARNLTAAVVTQLGGNPNRPAFFFEGAFSSGTLRYWTGDRDITFQSETYSGDGILRSVEPATETDSIQLAGMRVELSGLSPTVRSVILNNSDNLATGKLWLAMMDSNWAVTADEYLLFTGILSAPELIETGTATTASLQYETKLASLQRRRELRYTNEIQQRRYEDDKGLEYVAQAQNWTGYWGRGETFKDYRRRDRR